MPASMLRNGRTAVGNSIGTVELPKSVVPRFKNPEVEAAYKKHRKELKAARGKKLLPALIFLSLLYTLILPWDGLSVTWMQRWFGISVFLMYSIYWLLLKFFRVPLLLDFDRIMTVIFMYVAVQSSFTVDRWSVALEHVGYLNTTGTMRPVTLMEAQSVVLLCGMLIVAALLMELPPLNFIFLSHFTCAVYMLITRHFGSLEQDLTMENFETPPSMSGSVLIGCELYLIGWLMFVATRESELVNRRTFLEVWEAKQQIALAEKEKLDKLREDVRKEKLQHLEDALWDADDARAEAARQALVENGCVAEGSGENTKAILKRQSMEAGVSVAYLLSDEFLNLARGRTDQEDPSFHDLRVSFFGPNLVGSNTICPRDGKPGCALVDTLPRKYRRGCTHFLSWTWQYNILLVRGALENWVMQSGIVPEETFLFMCFFTNNQYRLLVEGDGAGSNNLEEVFEANLTRIGTMVALLDHWDEPKYLSRIWTIFEQFTAVKIGINVDMILPPSSSEALIQQIYRGEEGIVLVRDSLCKVAAENSVASMPSDEKKIKELIRSTIGFERVNSEVKQFLVNWVATAVKSLMDMLLRGTGKKSEVKGSVWSTARAKMITQGVPQQLPQVPGDIEMSGCTEDVANGRYVLSGDEHNKRPVYRQLGGRGTFLFYNRGSWMVCSELKDDAAVFTSTHTTSQRPLAFGWTGGAQLTMSNYRDWGWKDSQTSVVNSLIAVSAHSQRQIASGVAPTDTTDATIIDLTIGSDAKVAAPNTSPKSDDGTAKSRQAYRV